MSWKAGELRAGHGCDLAHAFADEDADVALAQSQVDHVSLHQHTRRQHQHHILFSISVIISD